MWYTALRIANDDIADADTDDILPQVDSIALCCCSVCIAGRRKTIDIKRDVHRSLRTAETAPAVGAGRILCGIAADPESEHAAHERGGECEGVPGECFHTAKAKAKE